MYSNNPEKVIMTSHSRIKKPKQKLVTRFTCKKHGRVDFKYDKLLNLAGKKFCPHCLSEFFMNNGICILEKSKEYSNGGKPKKHKGYKNRKW